MLFWVWRIPDTYAHYISHVELIVMKKSFSEFTTVHLVLISLRWLILLLTLLLDVNHSKTQKKHVSKPTE